MREAVSDKQAIMIEETVISTWMLNEETTHRDPH